jgi:hypothetical protein
MVRAYRSTTDRNIDGVTPRFEKRIELERGWGTEKTKDQVEADLICRPCDPRPERSGLGSFLTAARLLPLQPKADAHLVDEPVKVAPSTTPTVAGGHAAAPSGAGSPRPGRIRWGVGGAWLPPPGDIGSSLWCPTCSSSWYDRPMHRPMATAANGRPGRALGCTGPSLASPEYSNLGKIETASGSYGPPGAATTAAAASGNAAPEGWAALVGRNKRRRMAWESTRQFL